MRTPHRRRLIFIASCCGLAPIVALAHAVLVDSRPKQDGTMKVATTQAVLHFNARIEKKVTRVSLVDGKEQKVKLPPLPEDRDGPEDRLLVALPATLAPGPYRLEYTVLASDGHSTPGVLRFTVAAETPTTAPSTTRPSGGGGK